MKRFNTTVGFDSSYVSPAKSESSLPSMSENEDSVDNRFTSLFKNGSSPRRTSYQLATHSVSVKRSGVIGEVADIWQIQGEESPNQKQSLNRLKSLKGKITDFFSFHINLYCISTFRKTSFQSFKSRHFIFS